MKEKLILLTTKAPHLYQVLDYTLYNDKIDNYAIKHQDTYFISEKELNKLKGKHRKYNYSYYSDSLTVTIKTLENIKHSGKSITYLLDTTTYVNKLLTLIKEQTDKHGYYITVHSSYNTVKLSIYDNIIIPTSKNIYNNKIASDNNRLGEIFIDKEPSQTVFNTKEDYNDFISNEFTKCIKNIFTQKDK